LRGGKVKSLGNSVLYLLREISTDILNLFQDGDEGAMPPLIFADHLIDPIPFFSGDLFCPPHP
jgi:hypothetical protein